MLPIYYYIYLLQLENYNISRYYRLSFGKNWLNVFHKQDIRQKVVWTPKAIAVLILACILCLLLSWYGTIGLHGDVLIVGIIIEFIFLINFFPPIFLILAVILLWPFDFYLKQRIVNEASVKIARLKNLKIIAITGSFGKTTMKEALFAMLSEKYRVIKTEENINTPVGIARQIAKELDQNTEIYIVEMGAYHRGDIKALCEITPPDISVLTGINEAHLERFGSIENTIKAKFEIVENSKPDALVVLNQDNALVKDNNAKFVKNQKVAWYGSQKPEIELKTQLLGSYAVGVLNACVIIAKNLGLSDDQIKSGAIQIKPVAHRLQLVATNNGVTVIDDSYNGNPDGVAEAIKVLGTFAGKRKIYITPGLVEMGSKTPEIHKTIGRQLANVADLVILIRNSVTPFIADGLAEKGFDKNKIIWFDSATEAHSKLADILKAGDVVMFQNDWPDNYL